MCLFGFVKATKFRYSSYFSECVQTVLAKSCLPLSMFICKAQKQNCRPRKGLGTSLALQCYAGLASSSLLCKVAWDMTTGDKGKLFILFVLSKIVRSLWIGCAVYMKVNFHPTKTGESITSFPGSFTKPPLDRERRARRLQTPKTRLENIEPSLTGNANGSHSWLADEARRTWNTL